jgi:hypothetical protein
MKTQQANTSIQTTASTPHRSFLIPHFSFLIFSFLICSLLFVISCQTAPKTFDELLNETGAFPLEPGAFAYILADVQSVKSIFTVDDKQLQQMIDQTQFAVASIYSPQVSRRYQLTAWGKYPSSKAKIGLGASRDWKKLRSNVSKTEYWYSENSGLSVAMTPQRVFVSAVMGNIPDPPIDPFSAENAAIPEGFSEFRTGSVLSGWIDNPASVINQKLAQKGIPLEFPARQIFFNLSPVSRETNRGNNQYYEINLKIEVSSVAQARALTFVFSAVRGFLSSDGVPGGFAALVDILLANPPVQDKKYLNIKTNAISSKELSLLLSIFSLW